MDIFEFERVLLRLKEVIGVQTDKEIAALLGMDVSAFNKRKKRGSFPENRLFELATARPDLNIDTTYVLTGDRGIQGGVRKQLEGMARLAGSQPESQGEWKDMLVKIAATSIKERARVRLRRSDDYERLLALFDACRDEAFDTIQKAVRLMCEGEIRLEAEEARRNKQDAGGKRDDRTEL